MVDKHVVRRSYDQLAAAYAAERAAGEREAERAALAVVLESLPAGGRVLDVGCGQGTPVLSAVADGEWSEDGDGDGDGDGAAGEYQYDTVGIDVSRTQLEFATDTVPAASLVQGDIDATADPCRLRRRRYRAPLDRSSAARGTPDVSR